MLLPGGAFDAAFVTARRTAPEPGAPARLLLILWSMDPAGALTSLGGSGTTGPLMPQANAQLELAPYREAGVLSTVGTGAQAHLQVWGLDPENPLDGFTSPFRVVDASQLADGVYDTCRVPGAAAEGDFLIAHEPLFDPDRLALSAWRSGARP
jgi:hypothetical protein